MWGKNVREIVSSYRTAGPGPAPNHRIGYLDAGRSLYWLGCPSRKKLTPPCARRLNLSSPFVECLH